MCSKVVRSGIRWDTLSHYMAKTLIRTDMENYVLVYTDDNRYDQLDSCYAESMTSAQIEFSMRGWVVGTVMTEWDYQGILQDEDSY